MSYFKHPYARVPLTGHSTTDERWEYSELSERRREEALASSSSFIQRRSSHRQRSSSDPTSYLFGLDCLRSDKDNHQDDSVVKHVSFKLPSATLAATIDASSTEVKDADTDTLAAGFVFLPTPPTSPARNSKADLDVPLSSSSILKRGPDTQFGGGLHEQEGLSVESYLERGASIASSSLCPPSSVTVATSCRFGVGGSSCPCSSGNKIIQPSIDTSRAPLSSSPHHPSSRSAMSDLSLSFSLYHSLSSQKKAVQDSQSQRQEREPSSRHSSTPASSFNNKRSSKRPGTASSSISAAFDLASSHLRRGRSTTSLPKQASNFLSPIEGNDSNSILQNHPYSVDSSSLAASHSRLTMSDDNDDGPCCPVCVEPLSLRLQGEKPHITPVCGHRLHHECFQQVYGDVAKAMIKKTPLGLCGICRRDMKIGHASDANAARKNKFAAMAGFGGGDEDEGLSHKMRSTTLGTIVNDDSSSRHSDPNEDDDIVDIPLGINTRISPSHGAFARISSGTTSSTSTFTGRRGSADTAKATPSISGSSSRGSTFGMDVVRPIVTIRAEHPSIIRSSEGPAKQHLTCMVTVEMPSRWPTPDPRTACVPAGPLIDDQAHRYSHIHSQPSYGQLSAFSAPNPHSAGHSRNGSDPASFAGGDRPHSPAPSSIYSAFAFGSTTANLPDQNTSQDFSALVEDLQTRMADWKGHSPDEFGALKLFESIHVRKDANTREFLVYLFEEAILCVTDDQRKGLTNKIIDGLSGQNDRLRLKGRVYVRHIDSVIDTSDGSDLSLTIVMSDDALEEFVMTFQNRSTLEIWHQQISTLIARHRCAPAHPTSAPPPAPSAGARSRGMVTSVSNDSAHSSSASDSSRSHGRSSAFSGFTRASATTASTLGSPTIPEEGGSGSNVYVSNGMPAAPFDYNRNISSAALSLSGPREFASLDLMLILSVPASGPNNLKIGILQNTLDFILNHVGPRTRISLVTFSTGDGSRGLMRKSPFLAVGNPEGRTRLEAVISELGRGRGECEAMVEHQEDRVNVVTACNVALDIVLQRKVKSALTGMILMNDGKDGAQKQQMDLVMARAEAAGVPIHTIGWGRSHDPASLWLLSNHTGGSYVFVKDFYDLREAIAGCVGGVLSIAATNLRLHIAVPEQRWVRIRKVSGTPGAIVPSSGTDVDVEVGELRLGERKELLVEVELSFSGHDNDTTPVSPKEHSGPTEANNATDAFFMQKVGMNPSALEDYEDPAQLYDGEYDSMPDEIPLFEVNAAYRDPAAGKNISRLNHSPTLLTVTLIPPPSSPERAAAARTSDPEIIRRRMELLTSDMLSRALLLVTRKNDAQARRLLEETKRIISTIAATLVNPTPQSAGSPVGAVGAPAAPAGLSPKRRRSWISATCFAHATLRACAEDVSRVLEGCSERRDEFESHVRYVAAQSTVTLRDQKAWTNRSATERLFFSADHAVYLAAKSCEWLSSVY